MKTPFAATRGSKTLRALALIALNAFCWFASSASAAALTSQPAERTAGVLNDVNVFVGTGAHGHTYPGATTPFGMVQLSPDTRTKGWDGCAGYHYSDTEILGFSHTHLSGTGIGDMGDILLMPLVEQLSAPLSTDRYKSSFSHANEEAAPGYYRVKLDRSGVVAELTSTTRVGVHRYTFPANTEPKLIIDLVHGVNNRTVEASIKFESDRIVTGHHVTMGWGKGRTIYFALESSEPWTGREIETAGTFQPSEKQEASGESVRTYVKFPETGKEHQIIVRVGISAVSAEGALRNLRAEVTTWDFDAICVQSQKNWEAQLNRVQIASTNETWRQTFYSALYHTLLGPTVYSDTDGGYRGSDNKTYSATFTNYTTFSFWDTFRAQHPLITLTQPERVNDFVQSLLVFAQRAPLGTLPLWQLANFDTGTMIGYHAVPVIAEAYVKGFRGYDVEQAYQTVRASAMHSRNQQDVYQKQGFIPAGLPRGRAATARTLEFAFDDSTIAEMAKGLNKTDDVSLFKQRAQNYRNVWDPTYRVFRSKNADGSYNEPFSTKQVSSQGTMAAGYFVEANAWHYSFFVPQDVPGLIELYGGREKFIARLDEFFNQDSDVEHWGLDITGLIGQYAHGNEPCHHVAYLYALAGAQYKTAQKVRQIMLSLYDNTPDGLCGNDDCGQMSAWFVFSGIGLYPVNPVDKRYIIGSPLAEKVTLQLDPKFYPGKTFTILAKDVSRQNGYVKSAHLNGKELNRPWITHDEIVAGGTLELEMTTLPNKDLWSDPAHFE